MTKRKARPIEDVALPPWRYVVFTDLHVSANTLDRALRVLARVRETAREYNAGVICLGDFWHHRGQLNVRQLDALLDEFRQWHGIETILVPGNHDQVSEDGLIHGVRVFDAFANFTVATEPLIRPDSKTAFLPWREQSGAQAAMLNDLEGDGWTVFAHAEVAGATTNGAHTAAGRVGLSDIRAKARAFYCGHYHRRQKLGDRTWYIGSPFEMNFGERDMPHGIALIEQERVEPHFIDFDDFPKHHRLVYGGAWKDPEDIAPHDIVEIHAPPEVLGTEALAKALAQLPAEDIRTLPISKEDESGAPAIAMGLEEALHEWVQGSEGSEIDRYRMRQLGQTILAAIPEARAIRPLSPVVNIQKITVSDFCGIRGTQEFVFAPGVTLVKGPMGSGKTSLMDGLTWAFFGTTTPRKAGAHGAALKADEVIHDDADRCSVSVELQLQGRKKPIVVERTKKRKSGDKAKVTGIRAPDGIADQQDLIQSVLGIDHSLWRTCVYLGQGAVGNFVTDADKKRKELLSSAFGLDVCPKAQTYARDRVREVGATMERLRMAMNSDSRAIEVLQETDYRAQVAQWSAQHKAVLEATQARGEEAKQVIAQCEKHLEQETQWLESRQAHVAHIDKLTKSLVATDPQAKLSEYQEQLGAARAERRMVERDLGNAQRALSEHIARGPSCPTCGHAFDPRSQEHHLQTLEDAVRSAEINLRTFDARINNIQMQIDSAHMNKSAERSGIEEQMAQSREALEKCGEALNTMAVLRANKSAAEQQLSDARIAYIKQEREVNPFQAKQAECESKIASLRSKQAADRVELDSLEERTADLDFWVQGFGPKGIPVLVLRAALHELETYANTFMSQLLQGRVYTRLMMDGDDLKILFYETDPLTGKVHERRYEQLSGGQRRCVELAFNPFALGEMVFNRCGVRVTTLIVDEITTHLGQEEKPIVCEILRDLDRESIVVIDHDIGVQSEFDQVFELPMRADAREAAQ